MIPEKRYARKFEVVVIQPLDDGDFLVVDKDGTEKYKINEKTLREEYEEI